jgi:D-alanyl-D-alanine carboxypeptidase (penicillin-binding protein 5/6)
MSLPAAAAGGAASSPGSFHGKAAVVYDATTGKFLYNLNGDTELPMASLTKMMTALVALRDWHDDTARQMVVPEAVNKVYGEMIYLQPGETYTFRQMLLALLLDSANDAAVTIAVNVAGSQSAFVAEMNQEARLLGLNETHFVNVHGLDAPGHYSSAHDLALLGAAAMTDPIFRQIVALPHAQIPWPAKNSVRDLYNINRLVTGYFPGATGIKTGYTSDALNCVVGSADRGGHEVIAVVMGEGPYWVWHDEATLLNYGLTAAQAIPLPPPPPTLPMVVRVAATTPKVMDSPVRLASGGAPARSPWDLAAGVAAIGTVAAVVRRGRRPRRWRWRGLGRRQPAMPRIPRMPRLEPIPHSRIARHD